jgi:hypothetical protein
MMSFEEAVSLLSPRQDSQQQPKNESSSALTVFMTEVLLTENCACINLVEDNPSCCSRRDCSKSFLVKKPPRSPARDTHRWTEGATSEPDLKMHSLCRLPSMEEHGVCKNFVEDTPGCCRRDCSRSYLAKKPPRSPVHVTYRWTEGATSKTDHNMHSLCRLPSME